MNTASKAGIAGALLLLGGCVSMPSGPGVMVLPGTGKNFDQFRADDAECRQYASNQVGGNSPDDAAEGSIARSAALGAIIGGTAGAVFGGRHGAAAGAGTGLIVGGVAGTGAGASSQRTLQQRYDHGYTQCMYARGHKVPAAGRFENTRPPVTSYAPPPPGAYAPPPPPAGPPPPPPPGAR